MAKIYFGGVFAVEEVKCIPLHKLQLKLDICNFRQSVDLSCGLVHTRSLTFKFNG